MALESILSNLLLAGLGTVAYSYERAAAIVDQLIKKGELTLDQGKELHAELKRRLGTEQPSGLGLDARGDLRLIMTGLDEMKTRLDKIEEKLAHGGAGQARRPHEA